jgi:hypothetical protein
VDDVVRKNISIILELDQDLLLYLRVKVRKKFRAPKELAAAFRAAARTLFVS